MVLFTRSLIIISVAGIVYSADKDFPKTFVKCKRNDPNLSKCMVMAASVAIKQIKTGLPEFGILTLDPLVIDAITISQGSNSPVNIRQDFKNVKIHHISDSIIKRFDVDLDKFRIHDSAIMPRIEMIGDYVIDGRVLVLPITGKGEANVTLIEMGAEHEIIGESFMKNGAEYFRVNDYKLTFKPKQVYMHFDNLFNGDKVLGDTMNTFLNENWEIVFNEIKGGYTDTFAIIFKGIINKIFKNIPANKLFD